MVGRLYQTRGATCSLSPGKCSRCFSGIDLREVMEFASETSFLEASFLEASFLKVDAQYALVPGLLGVAPTPWLRTVFLCSVIEI